MKTTRIYLVGGSTEAHVVVDYVRRLSLAGYVITEDWASHVLHHQSTGGTDATLTPAQADAAADADLAGVRSAAVVWLLFPERASFGAGVEWGVSLERATSYVANVLVASGPYARSIFTRKAHHGFATHEEAFGWLVQRAAVEST